MTEQEKIQELEKRVYQLEKEAHDLKMSLLQLKRESRMETKQTPLSEEQATSINTNSQKVQEEKRVIDWEKQIGQVWMPRIFIFVLLLGVVWGFKAASDYGYLNHTVKIGIGVISAFVLFYLGQHQIKKSRVALGQVLLGGSIVLLFIVTFAAHMLYGMISTLPALLLNIVWIVLGMFLAHQYKSEPLAVLTAVGGFLIPFLLESQNPAVLNFVLFETLLYIAFLLFALKKSYPILYHVAFGLLHITLLIGALVIQPDQIELFGIAVMIQHIVLLGTFIWKHTFIKHQIPVLFTSSVLTFTWIRFTFSVGEFELFTLLMFAGYGILSFFYWKKDRIRLSVTIAVATVSLLLLMVSRFELENITGLLIVHGLISFFLGIISKSKLQQAIGAIIYIGNSFLVLSKTFEEILSVEFVNWVLLIGSVFLIRSMILPRMEVRRDLERTKIDQIVHIILLVLILFFITQTTDALTVNLSVNVQYMSISFAWAIYALTLITLGVNKKHKRLRLAGLCLLFVTLAKLILIDLAYISLLIRAILFFGIGVIGVVGSRIFYKSGSN
ncbi:DUF2339 domain-containing protein [Bacillus sp. AK128]